MNQILSIILSLIALSSSLSTMASESVIIKSPKSTRVEFQKELIQNSATAFSEAYWSQANQQVPYIESELLEAQQAYLAGELNLAKRAFANLFEKRLDFDWPPAERKAIHYAGLRLAQLTSNDREKQETLLQAASFAPDLEIDKKRFSPPTVAMYTKTKRLLETTSLSKLAIHWDLVILNGRKMSSQELLKVKLHRNSQYRLHLISNQYLPEVKFINGQRLRSYQGSKKWMALGDCENWSLSKNLSFRPSSVIFSQGKACIKRSPKDLKLADLKPESNQFKPPEADSQAVQITAQSRGSKPFYKKTWFWVTVGVVVTGAIIWQQDQQKKSSNDDSSDTVSPSGDDSSGGSPPVVTF